MHSRNIALYPLSVIYGLVTGIRNFLYNAEILHSREFPFPIICVGNITVGGTGKTPHTEYLAEILRDHFKVAILSRGYGRKTRDFRIVSPSSSVAETGDEPLQISRNFPDIVVAVDRNRVHGVNHIMQLFPDTEVIILDDAFQHRRITAGYSILLSDYQRLIYRDHMLPYGNLRESKINMRRADVILITKSPSEITPMQRRLIVKDINKFPYQNLYFTSFRYEAPVPVFKSSEVVNANEIKSGDDCGIVLVTGIANPKPLVDQLNKSYKEIVHLSFPDHHNFTDKNIRQIIHAFNNLKSKHRYIITTEKDAVRLTEFTNIAQPLKDAFFYVPVGICFLNDDKDEFNNHIINYVRKNHRNNKVSEINRNK